MPDAHVDDEALTDVVDAVAAPATLAHLEACAVCRARLAAIRGVVELVGAAPPLPSPAQRDAAVARALAGEGETRPAGTRRAPAAWLAAAALVALLLGIGGVVLARGNKGDETAAARRDDKAVATGGGTAGALSAGVPVDGGDLGDQRDPAALNAALEDRVGGVMLGTNDGGNATDSAAPAAPESATACEADASEAVANRAGPLLMWARLRWQGEPAVVFVYAAASGSTLRQALVMAQRDCRILVSQSF